MKTAMMSLWTKLLCSEGPLLVNKARYSKTPVHWGQPLKIIGQAHDRRVHVPLQIPLHSPLREISDSGYLSALASRHRRGECSGGRCQRSVLMHFSCLTGDPKPRSVCVLSVLLPQPLNYSRYASTYMHRVSSPTSLDYRLCNPM